MVFYHAAYIQPVSKYTFMIVRIKDIIARKKSKYQEIEIIDLEEYGRSLILDTFIQSSEVDEYVYHESLVHIPMLTHPNPTEVLIVGGGEGATLREVLKHNTVKKAVMVDIDKDVVEMSKKYLQKHHKGAFDDPRSVVIIADGKEYLKLTKDLYDVIILDLTDPYSSEIAKELYSKEFYNIVYRRLKDDGVMVTQAGNSFYYEDVYDNVLNSVKAVFPIVKEYSVWVPSFGYAVNYVLGSKKYDPEKISLSEVKARLKSRGVVTKFINEKAFFGLLYTPIIRMSTANVS